MSSKALARPAAAIVALGLSLVLAACDPPPPKAKKDLERVAVSVTHPAYRRVSDSYSVVGSIKANNEVTVLSETNGKIVEMPARIGAVVAKESPLVLVDGDLLEAALLAAESEYQKAAKDAERAASLNPGGLISDTQVEGAKLGQVTARAHYLAAKKEYENTTIRSPIAGTIADTYVTQGSQVAPGTAVAMVVDVSRLKVRVLLPERWALREKKGDRVAVGSDLFPARSFAGEIESVSVRGDETHSFPTEVILLGEASRELRAGMSIRLDFAGDQGKKALLIPRSAITGSVRSPEVFLVLHGAEGGGADDISSKRAIVTGEEYGTDIEVISGLTETDRVVTGGQSLICDNQAVRVMTTGGAE